MEMVLEHCGEDGKELWARAQLPGQENRKSARRQYHGRRMTFWMKHKSQLPLGPFPSHFLYHFSRITSSSKDPRAQLLHQHNCSINNQQVFDQPSPDLAHHNLTFLDNKHTPRLHRDNFGLSLVRDYSVILVQSGQHHNCLASKSWPISGRADIGTKN